VTSVRAWLQSHLLITNKIGSHVWLQTSPITWILMFSLLDAQEHLPSIKSQSRPKTTYYDMNIPLKNEHWCSHCWTLNIFSSIMHEFFYLQIGLQNINISDDLQAVIAPAILPRSFLSLQVLGAVVYSLVFCIILLIRCIESTWAPPPKWRVGPGTVRMIKQQRPCSWSSIL